ncbi:MAG: hypothetical protein J6V53_04365, partial [Alphaproteobacteria bacterium]|nr:hypothetical protein [Alphaproteobacteria bacterium]
MTNYSRTTLRELKKRYLNILKKCLLTNLLAFSFVLPSMAETVRIDNNANNLYYTESMLFNNLQTGGYGGAIRNKNLGFIEFYKSAIFENGFADYGGAIHNSAQSKIVFNDNTKFIQNSSHGGGAIANGSNSEIVFGEGEHIFSSNSISHLDSGGAILNNGKIVFNGNTYFTLNVSKTGNTTTQTGANAGAISNSGELSFNFIASFVKNSAEGNGGAIANTGNLTFSGETLFSENKAGSSGALHNDGGSVIFEDKVDFVSNQTTTGTAGALKNINNGKIVFKELARFENNYSKSNGGAIINTGSMTFEKGALFIGNINEGSEGGTVYSQGNLVFGGDVVFKNNIATHKGGMSAIRTGANTETTFKGNTVFEGNIGTSVLYNEGIVHIENDIYFINNTSRNGFSILESGSRDGEINLHKNFTFAANKFIGPNVGDIGIRQHNSLNILGKLGTVGTIEGGFSSPSWNSPGLINKVGTGLLVLGDQSENYEYKGKFNQTAGVTIANSEKFFSHELARNTINGGELKTHGSEIAYKAVVGKNVDESDAVLSAGKVMHYTTKSEMEVNATTLANITFAGEDMGATIGVGTYNKTEQEKEIALVGDRSIEYLDDKGTEDTSDDEMVRYQATDKLFTIDTLASGERTMFKVTGALPNEKGNKIAFANGIVEIDESIGKTGAIYELDNSVLETTSVQNKVLSKNMILGEAQEYSFTELEVADGTTLDVKNKKVSTDTLTMNDNAILNIDLNSVIDH